MRFLALCFLLAGCAADRMYPLTVKRVEEATLRKHHHSGYYVGKVYISRHWTTEVRRRLAVAEQGQVCVLEGGGVPVLGREFLCDWTEREFLEIVPEAP